MIYKSSIVEDVTLTYEMYGIGYMQAASRSDERTTQEQIQDLEYKKKEEEKKEEKGGDEGLDIIKKINRIKKRKVKPTIKYEEYKPIHVSGE